MLFPSVFLKLSLSPLSSLFLCLFPDPSHSLSLSYLFLSISHLHSFSCSYLKFLSLHDYMRIDIQAMGEFGTSVKLAILLLLFFFFINISSPYFGFYFSINSGRRLAVRRCSKVCVISAGYLWHHLGYLWHHFWQDVSFCMQGEAKGAPPLWKLTPRFFRNVSKVIL